MPVETTPRAPMRAPITTASLAAGRWQTYPAGHSLAGQVITRRRTCQCGRVFEQMLLSEREMEAAERMGVLGNMTAQIPDGYVPVHCPACESRDLRRQATIDEARARSRESGTYSHTLPDDRRAR